METLERRFGHLFPPEIMHLFKVNNFSSFLKNIDSYSMIKNTLRLSAVDRLTAEQCIQHDAFIHLQQKRTQRSPSRP